MITEEHILAYERDGAVCVRGLLAPEWIDLLNRGIDRNITKPSRHFSDFTASGAGSRSIKDYWSWEHIPEYQEFFKHSPTAEAAGLLMRANEVVFLEDQYFQKEAGSATPSPWHHDQPYYEVKGRWLIGWLPLDPCTRASSLEFVAGSHRWGKMFTPKAFSQQGAYTIDDKLSPLPSVPDIDAEIDKYTIVGWDLEPGDALFFHPLTLHGNKANFGARRARRFASRWAAEDAVFDEKPFPWATLIPEHGLRSGERLSGPKFPLVWTRTRGLVHA